ncbi:uncharacterized protein SRS1_14422 [Sporisorium reilianum f. sp. reilianum]|uniref:Uncharacterized protein n=1 Tax=Sporisorium reilianum f. sp. reilianum TaxID=72559 RepID=A0A2N8UG18_9BASI|nr:uncharacterized protein SRS1_14422 [Sporisorium reilianum f. sp. reilianum]
MTTRPSAPSSSSTGSPSLSAPPIRLRHPLPAPPLHSAAPSRSRSLKSPHPSSSSTTTSSSSGTYSTLRTSPRYSYPTSSNHQHHHHHHCSGTSPSTSPYYSSSHPSPAPSSTSSAGGSSGSGSAASSLRTPPDLLVNGSSVGHTGKGVQQLAVNTWNGLALKPRHTRNLGVGEIRRRQGLLADLPGVAGLQLPSPPPSPKPAAAQNRSGKKRRASDDDAESDPPAPQSRAPPPSAHSTSIAVPTTRTPSASAYRTAARDLKHAADARASSLSSSRPSYLASRPTQLSALEQLDAVLLFSYAFWLDDLASPTGTIAKNWISLFGLLRYATNAHSDLGNDVCLGVCRLVEAAVLRKLHAHDSAVLARMLDAREAMDDVAEMVRRQRSDLERSDRLAVQARTLLSVSNLSATHPELLQKALASTASNTDAGARTVDPHSSASCAAALAWPLDSISAIPHLVAFGRCALDEHARRAGVDFVLRSVVDDAPSSR